MAAGMPKEDGPSPAEFDDSSVAGADHLPGQLVAPPPQTDKHPSRIRSIQLRNFKRFDDFTLTLGPFNVLAGPNNAGKSTALQAIDLFFSLIKVLRDGENFTGKSRFIPAAMLPVAEGRDVFYGQVQRQGNVPVEASLRVTFVDGGQIAVGIRQLFGAMNCRILDANERVTVGALNALLRRPAIFVPSSVGIVRDEEYRTPARRAGLISAGRTNEVLRNVLLELRRDKADRYERLQQLLTQRFAAHVHEVAFEELTDQFLHATYTSDAGLRHDLYSAGAGFIQVLHLLTFVLSRDCSVVLLDEPDAHLHSSMQRVVVEVLEELARTENLQVLLSTHSKEIINFVDPSRLVLIEPGARESGPATDSVATITALRSVGLIDNVDAFELLRTRRCLFIEGKDEVTVLGRFAATLGISVFTGEGRVVAVPVGGASRFEHIEQLNVIEEFLGQEIASLELRDRDGLLDDLRIQIMKAAKRPLRIWERDSLESYLINGTVLSRLITEVAADQAKEITADLKDVVEMILACCDALRDETIDRVSAKYVEEVWLREKERVTIQDANQTARTAVGQSWGELDSRLKLVSGKKLIARVRDEVKRRYGVSFGNERLAEAFHPDEIPAEVREALKAVESIEKERPVARPAKGKDLREAPKAVVSTEKERPRARADKKET